MVDIDLWIVFSWGLKMSRWSFAVHGIGSFVQEYAIVGRSGRALGIICVPHYHDMIINETHAGKDIYRM